MSAHPICHLSTVHRRDDVRVFTKECVSLAARYHQVTLIVFDGLGDELRTGVQIHDLGAPPANRLKRMLYGPIVALQNAALQNATVVHFHDPELLPLACWLRMRGKKVIYDAHEDAGAQIKSKHYIPKFLRPLVAGCVDLMQEYVVRKLDAVVAATPYIGQRLAKVNRATVVVCNYPVVSAEMQSSQRVRELQTLCYVGAITRERSFIELLHALNLCTDVKIVVCGPFESELFEGELRSHSGWKHVDYRGCVNRQEVQAIMATSRAGVVLFHPGPNHLNAQPNKLFEYMSASLPVIASDFPLWRNIIAANGCGLLVNPLNPSEIANAIRYIHDNPESAARMGANGQKAVLDSYNWISEEKKLFALYDHLLDQSKK
jgi:glycosyltransferase involved in cell wall biosynthesis